MKRILAFVLVTALLLGMCSITAFAGDGDQPAPTVGPAQDVYMYGGARCGVYDTHTNKSMSVLDYDYDADQLVVNNELVPGLTYDMATNTLTADNVCQPDNQLYIWYMGNDFKLNIVGECAFGVILVYNYFNFHSTSLNIVGSGTLTVNEQKTNAQAIRLYSDGQSPLMALDIADSVTVNLYSLDSDTPVVMLSATVITPEQGGAITVGGEAVPEAYAEQITDSVSDMVPVVEIESPDKDIANGMQVRSKSDPDGVYSMGIMDGVLYIVRRWVYIEALGRWVTDSSFADQGYAGKCYHKDEFEAAYDYVIGQAPTPVKYLDENILNWIGTHAVKMTKDGEPDAIYAGLQTGGAWDWGDDNNYAAGYEIHRVIWDDGKQMYVEDPSFDPVELQADELEENGWQISQETYDKQLELEVWTSEDPDDDNRFAMTKPVLERKSDPEGFYVETGTYSTSSGETGISIHKVHYNPETDEHYILYDNYTSSEYFQMSDADLESGEGDFSYAYETVTESVQLLFLPESFDPERQGATAYLLHKTDDPDAVYAYISWTHHLSDDTEREEYQIIKLQYNEAFGVYMEDSSFDSDVFYDLSLLDSMGYEVVTSEQPLTFYTKGNVQLYNMEKYTDQDGNPYCGRGWSDEVFSYSEEEAVTILGEKYYFITLMPDMHIADLTGTRHDVLTDEYSYYIDGPEYHYVAGGQSDPTEPAQDVTFTVTADKTEVQPGDTVNFTVSMGAVSDLGTLKFKLAIPEGMTYAANSGKIVDGAKDAMNFDKLDFTETSKVVTGASDGTTDYTGTEAIAVATFQCTVNEGVSGTLSVGLTTQNGDFCSMLDDDIEFSVTSTPAEVTVVTATEPPVETYLLGDADDSGEVETLDCTILQKYLAWMDLDVDEAIVERNGDVDFSGEIETIDVTWIQKYLAWYDDIPYPIDEYVTGQPKS